MKCPFCGYTESKVIDSRPAEGYTMIRRRRECLSCQKRFTTYETIERMPLVVVKRDGVRQSFDRVKLINGMVRACEKRPVPLQKLEAIADEIAHDATLAKPLGKKFKAYLGVPELEDAIDGFVQTEVNPSARKASILSRFRMVAELADEHAATQA